jgi:hypothetical protein
MVDGDIDVAGTYVVTSIEYVQQLAQSGDVFHYTAEDPPLELVVEGFAEEDYLFAHTTGSAEMDDAVGGGSKTAKDLVAASWPVY